MFSLFGGIYLFLMASSLVVSKFNSVVEFWIHLHPPKSLSLRDLFLVGENPFWKWKEFVPWKRDHLERLLCPIFLGNWKPLKPATITLKIGHLAFQAVERDFFFLPVSIFGGYVSFQGSKSLLFHPEPWGNDPNLIPFFLDRLKPPPTPVKSDIALENGPGL